MHLLNKNFLAGIAKTSLESFSDKDVLFLNCCYIVGSTEKTLENKSVVASGAGASPAPVLPPEESQESASTGSDQGGHTNYGNGRVR